MTAISASQVKELRDRTGAGFMDCKAALTDSGGDIDQAIDALRKAGQAKADKKAGRATSEGVIMAFVSDNGKNGLLVEVNCETDFVGRHEDFQGFASQIAEAGLKAGAKTLDDFLNVILDTTPAMTIEEARKALVAKVGENVQITRVQAVDAEGMLGSYSHGAKIGVIVELSKQDDNLAKEVAMHIAANAPRVVRASEVSEDLLAREREIYLAQAIESGKPAEIAEKMVGGRLKKFVSEISLLEQPYVRDPEITVMQLLEKSENDVNRFVRFALGEDTE